MNRDDRLVANLGFPWNLITVEMLTEWSDEANHMSDAHMMGKAYLMISARIAEKKTEALHEAGKELA